MSRSAHPDRERKVFVVHGRNAAARAAMYAFLRSIGLNGDEAAVGGEELFRTVAVRQKIRVVWSTRGRVTRLVRRLA